MTKLTIDSSVDGFAAKFAASAAMSREGKKLIPGGYSRQSFNFGPHAVFVDSGDGAYIDTIDGNRLLDLDNNFTVNVLGHNHAAITSALQEAVRRHLVRQSEHGRG